MSRKYLPTLAELLDRLSINTIKRIKIPAQTQTYDDENRDIVHDLDLIIEESDVRFSGDMLRALVILAQTNLHIWSNEANARQGNGDGNQLLLSHGLNGVRNSAKNFIMAGRGRLDHKTDSPDNLPPEYRVSFPA